MSLSATPSSWDYAAILEASGSMLIACDPTGKVCVFNPAAEKLLGWTAGEVVGRHTPQLWHDRKETIRRAAELSEELGRTISPDFEVFTVRAQEPGGESREWTFIRRDGTRFPVQLVVTPIRDPGGAITGYVGTAQDISQRVRVEQERDRLFDLSLDILCIAKSDGYFKRVNPAFSALLGWSEDELLERPFLTLVHPDDQWNTQQEMDRLKVGQPTLTFENRYACKDGSWRILSWTGMPQPDGLIFATARDVTDLRRAEEELRHSQEDLAITLRSIGDGVIATDVQRRVTRLNPVAEQLTGWQEADAVGRSIDEVFVIVHEVTRRPAAIPVDDVLATGTVQGLANHTLLIARDGSERPIADSAAPIRDDAGNIAGVVLVFRDASSERDFQTELQQLNDDLEQRVAERTKELAKEQRRLRNGNLILESIASQATLPETLELIVRFVTEENAATRCGILLFDRETEQLELGAQRDLPEDFKETLLQRPRITPISWIWQAVLAGERCVVEDLSQAVSPKGGWQGISHADLRAAWAEPIKSIDGSILGVFVTFNERVGSPSQEDATCVECACGLARIAIERSLVQVALESSEARYRTLLERIPANIFVYDLESLAYLAVSDRAVIEYGYSREEFFQMTIADIRPQEDVPALRDMLQESGTGFEHRGVWRHQKKSGAIIDVEITTHGLELNGRPACIVLAKDVTEQLQAENALRHSEALNQAILQSSLDCIVTMNEAGDIVEFNRAAEQAFGYSRTEAIGNSMKELMIPANLREQHERGMARYLATGEGPILCRRIKTTALRRNGETFPVELTVVPVEVDGKRLFTAFLRDITLTMLAEQKLHRTTELLQAIADGTTDAVFVKDRQGRYLLFNQAAAKLTGRNAEEVLGKDDTFLFGNKHGVTVMQNDRLVMESNQPRIVEEKLFAAGTTRIYQAMKAPLRDPEGQVVGMIGISRDITERIRMESAMRASEERYRSIVEQSPDVLFVNREDRITFINQAGIRLLGASSADQILGRSPLDFFHPIYHAKIQNRVNRLLTAPCVVPLVEEQMVALNGKVIDVDVQAASYYSDGVLEIQVVCRDASARKRAEQDLRQHVRHAEFSAAIGLALSQTPTLTKMLQSCAEAMVVHLDAAFARVWTLNKRENMLELRASAGTYTRLDGTYARVPVGQKEIGRIASTRRPYFTNSLDDNSQIGDLDWAKNHGYVSFAAYPLLVEERCVGVIAIFANKALEKGTLECLAMAANGIAQNIDRKQSEVMLARLNTTLEQRVRERTRALEESEQFNRATLDALSAHVAVVDEEGNIVATNARWRLFAEENEAEARCVCEGANYLAVCDAAASQGDTDAALVANALREVLTGERLDWHHEYPCHSPYEQRWFICQVTRGQIGMQPHAVIAHEDVTRIKRVQEELREAKEKAIQASLTKSEFLAAMSHELRTPLNGILGMNTLLLQSDLDDRQRRFAEACASSGKLLAQLVNDVLDFSKIEAGKLELDPRPCEIEAVVYDVVDILSNTAQEKGFPLSCRLTQKACVTALVDDNRLRQILVNLVGNAIKFTETGGVAIDGDRIDHPSGQSSLRIKVTDSGIGIPPERIDRLFKVFSQVDSSITRKFGGSGLGLSICHNLVELMGGSIGVESEVGVGSTFWFEIPLTVVAPLTETDEKGKFLNGVRVVTIGCPDTLRNQLNDCVSNWGCDCRHTESIDAARNILLPVVANDFTPIVIATDAVASQINVVPLNQLLQLCQGRLVAFVADRDEASTTQLRSLGVNNILTEPLRPSILFDVLTSVLATTGNNAKEPSPIVAQPMPLKGHLLVAEDNKINQLYIVELLKVLGCTCDIVANGSEVLPALQRSQYDLVLMDCQMPIMDGFTAAREIRKYEKANPSAGHIPIVALTANALQGDRERCLVAGMDDYLKKPINADQLQTVLETMLQRVRRPSEL